MCGSENATFSNEKETHTMDYYKVLEDYSVESFPNYRETAKVYHPIIDDRGNLMFLGDTREGVVVSSLAIQVPKFSPKPVYQLNRSQSKVIDCGKEILEVDGETVYVEVWLRNSDSAGELLTCEGVSFADVVRAQHGLLDAPGGYFSSLPIRVIQGCADALLKRV